MANMATPILEEGNTSSSKKKRVTPSKRWCFTWFNYDLAVIDEMAKMANVLGCVYGEELTKDNEPHLQGYVEFTRLIRPSEIRSLPNKIHWERAKGDRESNIKYCTKEGKYYATPNMRPPRAVGVISDLRPWQSQIRDIVDKEPDDRTIYWFWETTGGTGKSAFTRYLCVKYNAIVTSGKAADMKYQIVKYHETHGYYPDIVIFDIPRCNKDYVSYQGLEDIKNGCFSSSKYESTMVIMPHCHVICFANSYPEYEKLSTDRWFIRQIKDNELALC